LKQRGHILDLGAVPSSSTKCTFDSDPNVHLTGLK